MKRLKTLPFLFAIAITGILVCQPKSAAAQRYNAIKITYEVQVEYWFFDTDYYYWNTVFETSDRDEAEFVYHLLVMADNNGSLNQAAPHEYWRYFAVDVRMVTKYDWSGLRRQTFQSDLSWYQNSWFR